MVYIYGLLNCKQQRNGPYLQMIAVQAPCMAYRCVCMWMCVAFCEEQEKEAGRLWCQDDGM